MIHEIDNHPFARKRRSKVLAGICLAGFGLAMAGILVLDDAGAAIVAGCAGWGLLVIGFVLAMES